MMKFNFNFFKLNKRKTVILSAMLVLLACLIAMSSVTFAKYVTTKEVPTQSATVAKWGFVLDMDATGLFGTNYGDPNQTTNIVSKKDGGLSVVSSSASNNVIAPGTTGSMTFSIDGQAEVAAQFTVTAAGQDVSLTYTPVGGDAVSYNPIKWTLKKDNADIDVTGGDNLTNVSLAEILAYLNNNDKDAKVAANNDYAFEGTYTLTWVWAFDNAGVTFNGMNGNVADTYLGAYEEAAVGEKEDALPEVDPGVGAYSAITTVQFSISIGVVQIQEEVPSPQP